MTVDSKVAEFEYNSYKFNVTDLPGTYSLTAYTPEELYVRHHIFENLPDIVVNVIDASNLERNLYLTTQLIDMDIKVVLALNMFDELNNRGDIFNYSEFGKLLGIPVVPTIGSKKSGINNLLDKLTEVYEDRDATVRHIHVNYGTSIEKSISSIRAEMSGKDLKGLNNVLSPRFMAIKLLENDNDINSMIKKFCNNSENIIESSKTEISDLEKELGSQPETLITDAKYGFIAGALQETFTPGAVKRRENTKVIDSFITHRLFGFPVFLFLMWLMFQITFTIGSYPMDFLDSLVGLLSNTLGNTMADGMLKDLLIDGVIAGVGGVIIFLPNILILFFFISLFEDTGYMARAVFIMDKIMHKIGLHGRSFIPMLMGFGCSVPAVMATRTIESRKNRLVTMLVTPFMSCGAKLPVYVLLTAAFFEKNAAMVIFSIYFTGISAAILSALIFKKTILKGEDIPFVMELPPYRIPTFKSIVIHMWDKGSQYLKKMGGVILLASIIIWALGYFPLHEKEMNKFENNIEKLRADNISEEKIKEAENSKVAWKQENSYIGKIGKFIEPVLNPIGFDWKMGVAVVTGIAAKEVVVSTLGVLYQANDEDDTLTGKLIEARDVSGEKVFNPLVAFCLMVFVLLYIPCTATVIAIKKESGSWKWALFSIAYTTAVAWIVTFIIYHTGKYLI